MRDLAMLIAAAALEVGGDALVRWGLRGGRGMGLAAGAATLFAYGLLVNLGRLDFGRLMGVYIAVFFVVSQGVAVACFHERVPLPSLVGGALIVTGGALISVWRPA